MFHVPFHLVHSCTHKTFKVYFMDSEPGWTRSLCSDNIADLWFLSAETTQACKLVHCEFKAESWLLGCCLEYFRLVFALCSVLLDCHQCFFFRQTEHVGNKAHWCKRSLWLAVLSKPVHKKTNGSDKILQILLYLRLYIRSPSSSSFPF